MKKLAVKRYTLFVLSILKNSMIRSLKNVGRFPVS